MQTSSGSKRLAPEAPTPDLVGPDAKKPRTKVKSAPPLALQREPLAPVIAVPDDDAVADVSNEVTAEANDDRHAGFEDADGNEDEDDDIIGEEDEAPEDDID